MPDLYPVFETPEIFETQQEQTTTIRYGKSWAFDFEKGEFVLDGGSRVKQTDGHTAWVHWCAKAVITKRQAFLVYGPGYGSEVEDAQKQPSRAATEAEMERAITEALLADPRTETVKDFAFEWKGDQVYVSFTVVPVIGTPERLEVSISGD